MLVLAFKKFAKFREKHLQRSLFLMNAGAFIFMTFYKIFIKSDLILA